MNLAVHLFSFIAFSGCIVAITGLHYRTQLTQKLLLALLNTSASTCIIIDPLKIITFIFTTLQIPLAQHVSLQQLAPYYKYPYLHRALDLLTTTIRWLKLAQPQRIALRELLATLNSLNINYAQYHEEIICHSFSQLSVQSRLTLVVSSAPAADLSTIEYQLAENLNVRVKIMVDDGTPMNHHHPAAVE